MKIKEIHEAGEWNDLLRKATGAIRQGNTAGKSQDNYKMYMDKFQKDLEAVDPEEAKELSELRADYKARPSAAAAQRLSTFILDRAKYVADKENAGKALAGAQDAMAKLKGQAAAPQARKVGSYSKPKMDTELGVSRRNPPKVDVNGVLYTFDFNMGKWTDEDHLPIDDPKDENELNKKYYVNSGRPLAATQSAKVPGRIAAAASRANLAGAQSQPPDSAASTQPGASSKLTPVSIKDRNGKTFQFNDSNRKWYSNRQEITDPSSIEKLNQAALVQFQNREMTR